MGTAKQKAKAQQFHISKPCETTDLMMILRGYNIQSHFFLIDTNVQGSK